MWLLLVIFMSVDLLGKPGLFAVHAGFIGESGTGKSSTMRAAMSACLSAFPRSKHIVFDGAEAVGGQYAAWEIVDGRVLHYDGSLPANLCCVYNARTLASLPQHIHERPFHVVQGAVDHDTVARIASEVGGIVLWADEIDSSTDKFRWVMPPALSRIIRYGRHIKGSYGRGVSLFWAARGLQEVHPRLLRNSRVLFCHRLGLKNDRDAVERWFGSPVPEIAFLPDLYFVRLHKGGKRFGRSDGPVHIVQGLSLPY